jgi:hypothetical protein|tara:strand:- start:355 stop:558 length:204 start_codon:yes stop_codon:yes gene_type:complete
MKKFSKRQQKKHVKEAVGITALVLTAGLALVAWLKKASLKAHARRLKKQVIQKAYFDTLTQKDVAWG